MKKTSAKKTVKESTSARQNHRAFQGFVNRTIEQHGSDIKVILNPIHDFEELRTHRESLYESRWLKQVQADKRNEVITDELTKRIHRKRWLERELSVVDGWILNNESSKSDKESIIIQMEKYRLYVQSEMEELSSKSIKGKKEPMSFKWDGNLDKEIPILYTKMVGQFISSDTTLEQFKAVFTGQPIQSIISIKWIVTKNLLPYFIESLYKKNRLRKTIDTDKWKIAEACFNGVKNMSQLVNNYVNNKKGLPIKHNLIDSVIDHL